MSLDKRLVQQAQAMRLPLALTITTSLLTAILTVGQAFILARIVNEVFLAGQTLSDVVGWLMGWLVMGAARGGLIWASKVTANRVAVYVKSELREQLMARIFELGPSYARGERTGELTNTLTEGIESLDAYFSQYLPQLALAALVPLTILIFVFPLDWVSGLVLLLTAPLIPLFMILIGNMADGLTRKQWTVLSRLSAHFLDVVQGLTTLKLLGRNKEQIETITHITDQFRQSTMKVLRVAFLSALVLEMVATLSTAIVAVQIGLRLLYGWLSFEQAFFVLILAPEFYLPLRALGASFHSRASALTAAARIFELLDSRQGDKETSRQGGKEARLTLSPCHPVTPSPCHPVTLSFEDVHYAYDNGQRPALNGVSFQITAGQKVALVGPTGAGKTTLAHLLLRFIEPQQGRILVNGVPLHQFQNWRAQVAWVPQNPFLFDASVADNIRLGRPEATQEQIEQAARRAHAHEFICALPQGYDTRIGERGARLSGGQAQRIALARAFLKDAPLLVLDEPTAHLDPECETLLHESIEQLMENRTALIIAHRLSTVQRADQVIALEAGRIVEAGARSFADRRPTTTDHRRPTTQYAARSTQHASRPPHSPLSITNSQLTIHLLRLVAPYWPWMLLATLMAVFTVGSGVGLMATSAFIIARAALHPSIAELQIAIVGVRFFGIARGLFRYLERYVSHQVTFRLLAQLRVWFYRSIEPLSPANLRHSADVLARCVADVESLEHFYARVIAPPAAATLTGIMLWIFMSCFDWRLALGLTCGLLAYGIGLPVMTHWLNRQTGPQMVDTRARLYTIFADNIQGIADLLAFEQHTAQAQRARALGRELARLQSRQARVSGLQEALGNLVITITLLIMLLVAIPLVNTGRIEGIYLAVIALATMAGFETVTPLPLAAQHLAGSLQAARRVFEISEGGRRKAVVGRPSSVVVHPSPETAQTDAALLVRDLRFRYAPEEPLVLDSISFTLAPGKCLAMVGPSGAGKTTLINVLARFWDYDEGQIFLGGRELREYEADAARRLMSIAAQNTHLFNGTIRDNLRLARPEATQAELEQAAQQAHIHQFIQSLPQGYDTWIGEHGLRLSGGERQRLAIARALLKDAPILILDEPTAHLDAATAQAVMQALYAASRTRAVLIITHRLVGLERADEILALCDGRIVERGRHAELLQARGLYRRMWDLQNQQKFPDSRSGGLGW